MNELQPFLPRLYESTGRAIAGNPASVLEMAFLKCYSFG